MLKLTFSMGDNDPVDVRAGGPPVLNFWVYTTLPREVVERVAKDHAVRQTIINHGGSGAFSITEETAPHALRDEAALKDCCIELAKQF